MNRDLGVAEAREVREARLAGLAAEVSRFWHGSHLYLRLVAGDDPPSMDWRTIDFPAAALDQPEAGQLAILFHEWGHRTISPGSPETSALWQLMVLKALKDSWDLAEGDDVQTEVHHIIVNMATDLWIDSFYLDHEATAGFYLAATESSIAKARERIQSGLGRKEGGGKKRHDTIREDHWKGYTLFQLFIDLYLALIAKIKTGAPTFATPLAAQAYAVLFAGRGSEEQRLVRFARLVQDLIPRDRRFVDWLCVNGTVKKSENQRFPLDRKAFIQRLKRRQLQAGSRDLKGVFGLKAGAELFARIMEMRLYAGLVDLVDRAHRRGMRKRQFAGYTRWRVGHRVCDLETRCVVERYGRIIPNINTLKKNFQLLGRCQPQAGMANVCLVVDDSGSIAFGNALFHLQEALFALVLAAEKRADAVALVVFGSQVTWQKEASFDYAGLKRAVASLEGGSGGTALLPAIEQAGRYAAKAERQTTFIFTDTYVSESAKELSGALARLAALSRIVVFAFSEERKDARAFLAGFPGSDRVKMYFVPPGRRFVESSLQEVYR